MELKLRVEKLEQLLKEEEKLTLKGDIENLKLQEIITNLKENLFTFSTLVKNRKKFSYLCGLQPDQFQLLMDCVRPYLSLLPHSACHCLTERTFNYEAQYLAVLTICRHALNYRFMAFMLKSSETTMQRIGNAWIIF